MKTTTAPVALLTPIVALFLLSGCKFDSPLTDKPARDVDPALLGSWFSLKDGSPMQIYRLSRSEYLAVNNDVPYVCTHSDLAGVNFVSCRQISNDKETYDKYAYIAYKLDKGDLVLSFLSEALQKEADVPPAARRDAVEQAVRNGKALDADPEHEMRFRKIAEP